LSDSGSELCLTIRIRSCLNGSNSDLALKGRGFKPRRNFGKITAALAAEGSSMQPIESAAAHCAIV
jgi:hypothetical protein